MSMRHAKETPRAAATPRGNGLNLERILEALDGDIRNKCDLVRTRKGPIKSATTIEKQFARNRWFGYYS